MRGFARTVALVLASAVVTATEASSAPTVKGDPQAWAEVKEALGGRGWGQICALFDVSAVIAGSLLSLILPLGAAVPFPTTSKDTCALLSPQVASIALKGPAAPDPVQLGPPGVCSWKVPALRSKSPYLTYTLARGGVSGRPGITRPVKGVGDAAFWVERDHLLYASRNNVSVDVRLYAPDGTSIGTLTDLSQVARDILQHF